MRNTSLYAALATLLIIYLDTFNKMPLGDYSLTMLEYMVFVSPHYTLMLLLFSSYYICTAFIKKYNEYDRIYFDNMP